MTSKENKIKNKAATVIQRKVRATFASRIQRKIFLSIKRATITIQRGYREWYIKYSLRNVGNDSKKVENFVWGMMRNRYMIRQFINGLSNPEKLIQVLKNEKMTATLASIYSNKKLMKYLEKQAAHPEMFKKICAIMSNPGERQQYLDSPGTLLNDFDDVKLNRNPKSSLSDSSSSDGSIPDIRMPRRVKSSCMQVIFKIIFFIVMVQLLFYVLRKVFV
jgi:hypothetical protein